MRFISKFAILALMLSVFISCDKDDEGTHAENILGAWRMTDIHSENGEATITIQGLPITMDYASEGNSYNNTITFTENPDELISAGSYVLKTTIETPGAPTIFEETVNTSGTEPWSINGDTLTQTIAGQTSKWEILELNKTILRLKQNAEFSSDEQGFVFDVTATVFSSFEKQ